jgi:hypothetical protein
LALVLSDLAAVAPDEEQSARHDGIDDWPRHEFASPHLAADGTVGQHRIRDAAGG